MLWIGSTKPCNAKVDIPEGLGWDSQGTNISPPKSALSGMYIKPCRWWDKLHIINWWSPDFFYKHHVTHQKYQDRYQKWPYLKPEAPFPKSSPYFHAMEPYHLPFVFRLFTQGSSRCHRRCLRAEDWLVHPPKQTWNLKMGAPWKGGDSELGNHHFQVNHVEFQGCFQIFRGSDGENAQV